MTRHVFEATVSALCHSLATELCSQGRVETGPRPNRVVRFVLEQHSRMPDFLRLPIRILTLAFGVQAMLSTGRCFHQSAHPVRWQHVLAWKHSRLGFRRDVIRFYESLVVLAWFSDARAGA